MVVLVCRGGCAMARMVLYCYVGCGRGVCGA
jgi:hypothetical protein